MYWPKALSRAVVKVRAKPRTVAALVTALVIGAGSLGWLVLRARDGPEPSGLPLGAAIRRVVRPAERPTRVVQFSEGCVTAECHSAMSGLVSTHAPVAASACQVCHAPDRGGHEYPLIGTRDAVCASCHDTGAHHRFQHKAMGDDGGCLACHDPHASRAPFLLVGESINQTCARCHPKTEGSVHHKPYLQGRCDSCHDPHSAENADLLLGGSGEDHCRRCHEPVVRAVETGAHSHRKAEGSCLACHAPHAAEHKSLLVAQPRSLCIACHADVGKEVSGAVVSHDPLLKGDQCATCHDPHASEHPAMLRDSQARVCLSCHDKQVKAADGRPIPAMAESLASSPVVHGAVRRGDCSACHSVHGSSHAKLLRAANAPALSGPYDIRNYALCFACHDKDLASGPGNTQFRDGVRNLHEVHLNAGTKSRGCATCHAVHSGDLPRLIAKNVNYEGSGWVMPMEFKLTADGGSCAPGCHEPLSYSRRPGGARAPSNGGAP